MDVQKKLDDIVSAVEGARSMPMSASCVVNRADLLALLEQVREALPGSLAQAQELLGGSEQVVEQARQEAERIIETAHAERGSMISEMEIVHRSQAEADKILAEARQEAEEIKAEADDYVDSKLANFEVVLTKTLGSVGRGREKLLGTGSGIDQNGYEDPDYTEAPERSQDPETLRERADAYVDVKLGAFEAVLAKTLEAVGRGRQKLHGRVATDELGTLADGESGQHTSDADYLAELADPATRQQPVDPTAVPRIPQQAVAPPPPPTEQPAAAAAAPLYAVPDPDPAAYGVQDPYGYQQDPYQQDVYAYQQQAAYAQQQDPYQQDGYGQQDPYATANGFPAALDPSSTGGVPVQQGYDPAQTSAAGYGALQGQGQPALDETSFFDTGMISAEQLRQYEQQRYEQGR
ncbi:ATP synthase F0 subunit B [Streptomyces odontomachi]|uniref:ATP synthase F0 subunit B n=1 Tax=Streptomyces odontomachi TaxID=2944940 RepID=UPI00210E17E2|nr:ATP synthase F0 subunit B [Streptomyces sp. ODS25]